MQNKQSKDEEKREENDYKSPKSIPPRKKGSILIYCKKRFITWIRNVSYDFFLDHLYTVTKTFLLLYVFMVKKHENRIEQIQTMSRAMRGMENPVLQQETTGAFSRLV